MTRSRIALLTALGVDNFGSGLFLPVVLLYVTRVVGLPLAVAGTVVAVGSVAGLAVPPVAGRLVDRAGPRRVVIAAELVQALGAVTYLAARGPAAVAAAAVLLAAGQQAFYSALFALIADVAGDGAKDHPYAVAGMVRSACFGLGGLAAAGLLTLAGREAYRQAVIVDAVSFLLCALLLALLVRDPGRAGRPARTAGPGRARVLADRPFLVLIVATGLAVLPSDVFLSGMSVYLLTELHTPAWLPGALLALLTGLNSVGATAALRVTRGLRRTTAMALGAGLYVLWCAASLAALAVPPGWRPAELMAATLLLAAAGLLFGSRANALAEAAAPGPVRGRYLAAFQYAFTIPGVLAPAVVALFSIAVWLPWLLAGLSAGLALLGLGWLAGRLPAAALRPAVFGAGTLDRVA
jgi:Na+/melibiose symporter-like transporter